MVDGRGQSVPDVSTLHIRKATVVDHDAIERNINAVCREGIYLVPSRFVMPEDWRKIMTAGRQLDRDPIIGHH